MNIREASQITAISKDMIRHYEKIGLIKPVRSENGYRDFSEDDLNTLVVIRTLSNSHISLKQIRSAFQSDSVDALLNNLTVELENTRRLQRQLKAREHAVRIEIEHMQQYASKCGPLLCHYPARWIVCKTSRMDASFKRMYQTVVDAGEYFHYVACYDADLRRASATVSLREQGILLYNEFPGARYLPEQDCLRFIATHEAGRMLSVSELTSFAETAKQRTGLESFSILAYQFFRCMGQREECVVCVEVLLGDGEKHGFARSLGPVGQIGG
ncbi:MAG: MerR family transcriptional regulator [Oscillospiraceae bacterium]|jgi:DNA-binding transcriptional MerR regulator|nr:MerR family transcriptional regulator [Oscillospiraceae bacterium]